MLITLIIVSCAFAFGFITYPCGQKLFAHKTDYKANQAFEREYSARNLLTESMWQELKRCIAEDCKGYLYADSLIKEVINQDHRFTCKQIYELREIYTQKWAGIKQDPTGQDPDYYVNKLTQYDHVRKIDAEEKIFGLLNDVEPQKQLTG